MLTPKVITTTPAPTAHPTLDPAAGTGQTIVSMLDFERDVYDADPTGGNPSAY